MIRIIGEVGKPNPALEFSARPVFKDKVKTIERKLIYGHYCPRCYNVVQALFETPEEVDLRLYEETTIISLSMTEKNYGKVNHVVPAPDSSTDRDTMYRTKLLRANQKLAQHIALKNHILTYSGIDAGAQQNNAQLFESGHRPCEYVTFFALREDLVVRDAVAFLGIPQSEWDALEFKAPLAELVKQAEGHGRFGLIPAFGKAPPLLRIKRESVADRNPYYLRSALQAYNTAMKSQQKEEVTV